MLSLRYTRSFKALDEYVRNYNQSKIQLAEQVRQSTVATAKEILRLYGPLLAKANQSPNFDPKDPLPIKTNNKQLATMTHSSSRTIQRHIKRLQEAGIISHKIWHGSNANYELWINPQILLLRDTSIVENQKSTPKPVCIAPQKNSVTPHISSFLPSICPHTDTSNLSGNLNNSLIAVENSTAGYLAGNYFARYTGRKVGDPEPAKPQAPKAEETGRKVRSQRVEAEAQSGQKAKPDPIRSAFLALFVTLLWKYAKEKLYANTYLTLRQEKVAKELLRQWYEPMETADLAKIHQIYLERIELVEKYLAKDPENRYVQLPYQYFDLDNPHGFLGTKKWWQAHRKRRKTIRAKRYTQMQVQRILRNEGKSPEQQKDPFVLYRDCETKVRDLDHPECLQEFYASVLQKSTQAIVQIT